MISVVLSQMPLSYKENPEIAIHPLPKIIPSYVKASRSPHQSSWKLGEERNL